MIQFHDDVQKATTENIVAKKLRAFLNAKEPQLVYFLQTLWESQRRGLTYKEIREAVLAGYMNEELFEEWRQDYAAFVVTTMQPLWADAIKAAAGEIEKRRRGFLFNGMSQGVFEWVDQAGAQFVTVVGETQINAMKALIHRSATMGDFTVDELSKAIRPLVGLTTPQSLANLRYYATLRADGMKHEKALEKQLLYGQRQHMQRGYDIARTELAYAYNRGELIGAQQAVEQGYMGRTVKVWVTAADERVCFPAGTMVATPSGQRPIEEIKTGDMVTTPEGPKRVMKTLARKYCGAMTYVSASGREVLCTKNHPFKTMDGWKAAEDLRPGDTVYFVGNQSGQVDTILNLRFLDSKVYNLAVEDISVYYANDFLVHNCDLCGPMDGTQAELNEEFPKNTRPRNLRGDLLTPPLHPRCLFAGAQVVAGDVIAGSVRRFEGEAITFCTSGGNELTCTPNHPVLTNRGWIGAGELQEGDKVVEAVNIDAVMGILKAKNYNVPTPIEQIANSFLESEGVSICRVPISAEDFHGDGIDGDIGIIYSDSLLLNDRIAELLERGSNREFGGGSGSFRNVVFKSNSFLFNHLSRLFLPSNSIMSGSGQSKPFFSCKPGHSNLIGLTSISDWDALIRKDFANSPSFLAKSFGDSKNGIASGISGNNSIPDISMFFSESSLPTGSSGSVIENAMFHKEIINGTFRDAEGFCDLINSKAGDIKLSSVVSVKRKFVVDHVYNLQTESNVYVANNIITHNCRCAYLIKEVEPGRTTPLSYPEMGFIPQWEAKSPWKSKS